MPCLLVNSYSQFEGLWYFHHQDQAIQEKFSSWNCLNSSILETGCGDTITQNTKYDVLQMVTLGVN